MTRLTFDLVKVNGHVLNNRGICLKKLTYLIGSPSCTECRELDQLSTDLVRSAQSFYTRLTSKAILINHFLLS